MTPHKASRLLLLILTVIGFLLPWRFNWQYFAEGGSVLPGIFFGHAFANPLTTAITLDVYLAAVAFSVGVAGDSAAGRSRWWAIPVAFFVGLSFALPGYLWWRSSAGSFKDRREASDHHDESGCAADSKLPIDAPASSRASRAR